MNCLRADWLGRLQTAVAWSEAGGIRTDETENADKTDGMHLRRQHTSRGIQVSDSQYPKGHQWCCGTADRLFVIPT